MKINFNAGNTILMLLCVTSLCLTIWGVDIYRHTIIQSKFLFITSALGAVVACIVLLPMVKSSYFKFWRFFVAVVIGSALFYSGTLILNSVFSDHEVVTESFRIIRRGTLARSRSSGSCDQPYAIIDFHGQEKELVFYCQYQAMMKTSSQISLTYSKGLFGFDTIKSKQLIQ